MIHPDDLPPEVRAQLRPADPAAEAERAETESRLTARLEELEARVPREQARRLDPVENTRTIVDWVNETFGELPGWQALRLDEAARKPPPKVDLPPSVDALDDDTYDAIRRRIGHLEDTRQRQADEIGKLLGRLDSAQAVINRVRDAATAIHDRHAPYEPRGVAAAITEQILAALDNTPEKP